MSPPTTNHDGVVSPSQQQQQPETATTATASVVVSETSPLLISSSSSSEKKQKDEDNINHDSLFNKTTFALAFALLVQSYLLVSVFPYSGFLALHLIGNDKLTEETVGSYAGLIASSFMIGRTITSFEWGKAADKYGRVFVIKTSLASSAIFSVFFGLAPTFGLALGARFALGLCNGLIGPIKTLITELSRGDHQKETNMIALIMGMWGYGFLINPAISGYLSDPVKQYPRVQWIQNYLVPTLQLDVYPYLLPNLLGCGICAVGFVLVHCFVEETLPEDKRQSFITSIFKRNDGNMIRNVSSWGLFKHLHCPDDEEEEEDAANLKRNGEKSSSDNGVTLHKWIRPSPSTTALTILSPRSSIKQLQEEENNNHHHNSNDQENHNEDAWEALVRHDDNPQQQEDQDEQQQGQQQQHHAPATIQSLMKRKSTRRHLLVYWVYSFLVITIDEVFPLYCISKASGLGIEEKMIGSILSGTGLVYIFLQYFLLTQLVDRYGFYTSMRIGALGSIPTVCLLPLSLLTNQHAPDAGGLTWSTIIFLSVVYAVVRAFSSVTFSTITMTTNRTVPPHHRATMNGLSMLGGSLAKGIGPAFAGILFSTSVDTIQPPFGSVFVYCLIAAMGLGLYFQTLCCLPEHTNTEDDDDEEEKVLLEENPDDTCENDDDDDKPPSF